MQARSGMGVHSKARPSGAPSSLRLLLPQLHTRAVFSRSLAAHT